MRCGTNRDFSTLMFHEIVDFCMDIPVKVDTECKSYCLRERPLYLVLATSKETLEIRKVKASVAFSEYAGERLSRNSILTLEKLGRSIQNCSSGFQA